MEPNTAISTIAECPNLQNLQRSSSHHQTQKVKKFPGYSDDGRYRLALAIIDLTATS